VLSDTPEQTVERCPAGALAEQGFESRGQRLCVRRRWRGPVDLEIGVVGPDFPAHAFLLAALDRVGRNQLVYQSLGMHPAEAVLQEVELPGAIADDGQHRMDAFGHEAAQQAGLGGDATATLIADTEAVEIRRPVVTGKRIRLQQLDKRRLQSLFLQVAQGDAVQRIGRLAVMQVGQEADTALVVGAAEPGEGRAADDGDVAILALVARTGVVDRDGRTDGQARFEQAGLLGREGLLTRRQQGVDLADGEVEASFAQLLVQLRLRDVAVVVLVQNEGTQARTEMPSAQLRRAIGRQYSAVRGRPTFEQEAGVVRADLLVLHREGAVAQKV
jgi:hypothetical protein